MWDFFFSPTQPWKIRPLVHEREHRLPNTATHILEDFLCTPLECQSFSCNSVARAGAKTEKPVLWELGKRKALA